MSKQNLKFILQIDVTSACDVIQSKDNNTNIYKCYVPTRPEPTLTNSE